MYKELRTRLINSLKAELDYVAKSEADVITKFDKMSQIRNLIKLIENYEELEPNIAKAINELARKKKFEEER